MSLAIPSTLDILTLGKSTINLFSVLMKIRYRRHEISLGIASGEKEHFGVLNSVRAPYLAHSSLRNSDFLWWVGWSNGQVKETLALHTTYHLLCGG